MIGARNIRAGAAALVAATLATAGLASVVPAGAFPGELDSGWDGDGLAITAVSSSIETDVHVASVQVAPDGKIVVAGDARRNEDDTDRDLVVFRFLPDGTLDTTFSGDGIATAGNESAAGKSYEHATDVVVQPDGAVIVGGSTQLLPTRNVANGDAFPSTAVVRFDADGSFDQSFGADGWFTLNPTESGQVRALALDSSSRILVAFSSNGDYPGLLRLLPDGTMDESYGANNIGGSGLRPVDDIVVDPNDNVFVVGRSSESRALVTRVLASGAPDGAFGIDGDSQIGRPGHITIPEIRGTFSLAVVGTSVLVAGSSLTVEAIVARVTGAGALDPTFGSNGLADTGAPLMPIAITTDANGNIDVAGTAHTPTAVAAIRLDASGTLDAAFGTRLTTVEESSQAAGVAVDSNGNVVVAGTATSVGGLTNRRAVVARHVALDGAPDPTFDGDGIAVANFDTLIQKDDTSRGLAVDSTGRVISAGWTDHGQSAGGFPEDFLVLRHQSDGELDPAWGGDGIVTTDFGGTGDKAQRVLIDSDGSIVVAGTTCELAGCGPALARYLSNGTLDDSFDGDGRASFVGFNLYEADDLAIDASGRFVIAGRSSNLALNKLMRVNEDGTLDTTFGTAGVAQISLGQEAGTNTEDLSVVTDGNEILVVSDARFRSLPRPDRDYYGLVARFDETGAPDLPFGANGRMKFRLNSGHLRDALLDADGGLLVAGETTPQNDADALVARIDTVSGELDAGFGTDGSAIVVAGTYDNQTGASSSEDATALALDGDGNIVVGGYSKRFTNGGPLYGANQLFAARFSPTGAIDTSFGTNGFRLIDAPASHWMTDVPLSGGGSLFVPVAVGVDSTGRAVLSSDLTKPGGNGQDVAVWRLLHDGGTPPDVTAPSITVTAPTDGAQYMPNASVLADYTCADDPGGSGIAGCNGTVASGAALDTSQVGPHEFTATAQDAFGNTTIETVTYIVLDASWATFGDGGGVTGTGDTPTPDDPLETQVQTHVAGPVTITERPTDTVAPSGYVLGPLQADITAPPASGPDDPLVFEFLVDGSVLTPLGVDATTLVIFRNGVVVPECTDPGIVLAAPDPCVAVREPISFGGARIHVYTTAASVWNVGAVETFPVTSEYTVDEHATIALMAPELGVTPEQLQRLALYLVAYVTAGRPGPSDPLPAVTPEDLGASYTTRYSAEERAGITTMTGTSGLTDTQLQRVATYFAGFLYLLGHPAE